MRNHIFTLFAIFCSTQIVAQSWHAGGFVNNEGDSIKGFIELTESTLNPTTIRFKETQQSDNSRKFATEDIRSFWYDFGERYVRYEVFVSMDYVDLEKVVSPPLPEPVERIVLLKEIASGAFVTLYSYEDEIKKRFYYQKSKNTVPEELPFSVIKRPNQDVSKEGRWVEYKYGFRDKLSELATSGSSNRNLQTKIKRAEYRAMDLISVVNDINGLDTEILARTKGGRALTFGVGAMNAKYQFMDNTVFSKNGSGSSSVGLWASVGYDMLMNPRVGRFVVRTRVQFSKVDLSANTYDDRLLASSLLIKHDVAQLGAAAQIGLLYNLVNSSNVKAFVGGGVRGVLWKHDYDFVVTKVLGSSTTVSTSSKGEPRKFGIGIPFTAGILLKKRIELSASYLPTIRLASSNANYKYGVSALEAGVVWHLETERQSQE